MVLIQYYNLLISSNGNVHDVIGEDVSSLANNSTATDALSTDELVEYNTSFASITSLRASYKELSALPPGDAYTALQSMDLSACKNVSTIPASWNTSSSVLTLDVSKTAIASIPSAFDSVTDLNVSGCRAISSIDIPRARTLNVSRSTITELLNGASLQSLYAVQSRISHISSASLVTLVWNSDVSSTLVISSACASLVSVVALHDSTITIDPSITPSMLRLSYMGL